MKAFIYNILIVALFITMIVSCSSPDEQQGNLDTSATANTNISVSQKQFDTGGMKLGKLTKRELSTTVSSRGYIDVPPANRAAVSPYFGGYVTKIDVLPGQEVKKGELLFVLQNPDYIKTQQAYLELKEQLAYLKIDFDRQQTLADEQIASQKNFKKAESDYRVMLAKFKGLEQQLKLMNISIDRLEQGDVTSTIAIYAPISGFITKVNTMKSAFIHPSDDALEIVNTDHIHLELKVFEKDAMQIQVNQPIRFSAIESSSEWFLGEVHMVGKSIDQENRTVDIHGHIAEKDAAKFIPGMYVEAAIEVSKKEAFCLPESAIIELDNTNYILVQIKSASDMMQFTQQQVIVGKRYGEWIEIENTEDLKDKAILVKGAFALIGN